jgi:hypothetical protein
MRIMASRAPPATGECAAGAEERDRDSSELTLVSTTIGFSRPRLFRREPSCYAMDIAKHKLAARKKTSENTSSPVDQPLLLIAWRRCRSMTLSRSGMSG